MRHLGRRAFMSSVVALAGCGASTPVFTGGRRTDPRTIDADPLAVLPSGIVLLTYIDLQAAYRSNVGGDISALVSSYVPFGPEAGFSPTRDTTRFYGGIYAMQGIDYCAVVEGRFDVAGITRAADARLAQGLVKTRYADSDIYTKENNGFTLLTPSTLLCGNETGMRRALDRLRHRHIERSIPSWMVELTANPQASIALAGDFGADGVLTTDSAGRSSVGLGDGAAAATAGVESVARSFPFLNGLRVLRAQGAFVPSGVSFVGALTYDTEARAEAGSTSLAHVGDQNPFMNLLMSVGLGASIQNPDVARSGRDVAFVEPVDQALMRAMLGYVTRAAHG